MKQTKLTSSKGGNRPSKEVMNWNTLDNIGFPCTRENRKLDKIAKRAFKKVLKKDKNKVILIKKEDRHCRGFIQRTQNKENPKPCP